MLVAIAVCLIILAVFNIIFGGLVFWGSRRTKQAFLFMVFDVAVALWGLGIGLLYITTSPETAVGYVRLYYFAAALIAYSLLLFVINYIGRKISWPVLLATSLPFAFIVYLIMHPMGLVGDISLSPIPNVVLNAPIYLAYTIYFVTYFIAAVVVVGYGYLSSRNGKDSDKMGALYILIAITTSGIFGMIFNLTLPWIGNYELIWVGPLGSIWMVSLIFIAVIRHSLFDIRLAMFSVLGYFLLALGLMGIIATVLLVTNGVISGSWTVELGEYITTIVVAGIVAVSYQPLRALVDKIAERIFFKHTYETQLVLSQFNKIVVTETDLRKLLQKTQTLLSKTLRPVSLTIVAANHPSDIIASVGPLPSDSEHKMYMAGKRGRLEAVLVGSDMKERESLIVHLQTASQATGYMIFGPKQGGELYRSKDMRLIELITTELSIAVQNGLRYEEINNFNTTLRRKVDDATVELRTTNQRLKQLDQTKDEFISMTSHQLRTPLTTIKGYISMLLDGDAGELQPQQRKLLEEAFSSSQRMVHLIGDFLNVSRIQTGKFEINLTEVNLAEILSEEIEQQRISATSRQLKLIYAKPDHFPVMQLDEDKIRQVMMNFVDNAIYYSPAGSDINIILSANADAVEFKVIDQGIGVPAAEQHKLFTKFARASNAKKQRPDGTGIGLFMAKKVIVALGGSIIFQSKEGKGSTFGFRLNRKPTVSMPSAH